MKFSFEKKEVYIPRGYLILEQYEKSQEFEKYIMIIEYIYNFKKYELG